MGRLFNGPRVCGFVLCVCLGSFAFIFYEFKRVSPGCLGDPGCPRQVPSAAAHTRSAVGLRPPPVRAGRHGSPSGRDPCSSLGPRAGLPSHLLLARSRLIEEEEEQGGPEEPCTLRLASPPASTTDRPSGPAVAALLLQGREPRCPP
jgi:hypothetical protein